MANFRLLTAALFPAVLTTIIYLLEKKTKFNKLPYAIKQIIIGVVFGASACLATQFSVPMNGANLNVRCASPLAAGLIFGGPSGIIAGLIGGVFRWISVSWGIGTYTRLACTLGTIFAGFIGALCRKFLFDNKKTSWFYGFFIGMNAEILHMLLVFCTHLDDIEKAFEVVKSCALPMIIATGLSVTFSIGVVTLLANEKLISNNRKQIAQTFSISLLICVVIAFSVTGTFTFVLQNQLSKTEVNDLLKINVNDIKQDILDASDSDVLKITEDIKQELENEGLDNPNNLTDSKKEKYRELLKKIAKKYEVTDINIVNDEGIIVISTYDDFENFDMSNEEYKQANEFICLNQGEKSFVQEYKETDYDSDISRKYAGVAYDNGGFIQVGYSLSNFQNSINDIVSRSANNRHIDESGFAFIINEKTFDVVSTTDESVTKETIIKYRSKVNDVKDDTVLEATLNNGEDVYFIQEHCEGYIIIGCVPVDDAHFSRNISTYVSLFMQTTVFAILFILIYIMIKKLIVDNIHLVNKSLAKIASGNLETKVDVRSNEEFASLSDDINSTVNTLKTYISDAETRVQKELEFAKTIQLSSLPSVFPPFPNRQDFDIYASMNTAKEVGGDFYDFYFVGENNLLLLIADVSGKGIPAAMFMMTAKTLIKSLAETGLPIDEIMTQANDKLCQMNDAGMFVTVWAGILDLSNGKLNYVSAGHNPPLIKHQYGGFEYAKGRSGLVLAGMDGIKYKSREVQLLPNDRLFLYTDGVTEATDLNNQLYSEDRLKEYLNSTGNLDVIDTCKGVLNDVNQFVGEAPQFDDITMLMFKLNEINNYNELTLAPTVDSIPRVTEFIESWMYRTKVEEKIIKRVNIIVDEIYSNIANYSGALWARVHYTRDLDNLYLTFVDNGVEYNPLNAKAPDTSLSADDREIGGLGIMMVKKIATDVSYKYVENTNNLTITISL